MMIVLQYEIRFSHDNGFDNDSFIIDPWVGEFGM